MPVSPKNDRLGVFHARAHAGKQHHRKEEAKSAAERRQQRLAVVHAVGDDVHRHAQHAAVRRDKRQIDAQRLVQRRNIALEHDLHELHQRRDDKDEHDRLHIGKVDLPCQQEVINGPCDSRCEHLDKDDRKAHARRLIELFRHAEERADAEEFDEHIVVRNCSGQNDQNDRFHFAAASFFSHDAPLLHPGQPEQPKSFFLMALPFEILLTSAIMQP